jgi:hypothetical protein
MKTIREFSRKFSAFIETMWIEMCENGEEEWKDTLTLDINVNGNIRDVLDRVCKHFNNINDDFYVEYDTEEHHIYTNKNLKKIHFSIEPVIKDVNADFYEFEIEDDEVIVDEE